MDWLRYLQAPQIWPANNPVGTSRVDVMTTPRPTVSPVASAVLNSPDQRIGRFWKVATGQAKEAYTGADMADLAKAGNEGLDAALGWAGMTTPIRAFHGSPHTFDRFSMDKIGTGEGAQAYGHGLYFAGNEGVARAYRDTLAGRVNPYEARGVDRAYVAAAQSMWGSYSQDEIFRALRGAYKNATDKQLRTAIEMANPGSMYEVSLRTSPQRLLDWDKPLSQQPAAVREAVLGQTGDLYRTGTPQKYRDFTLHQVYGPRGDNPIGAIREEGGQFLAFLDNNAVGTFNDAAAARAAIANADGGLAGTSGATALKRVAANVGGEAQASEALRQAGLDGIQYLDAGSRAAGDGSRNYVMFRDDIIDILKRYGLFGLGMVGGGAAATQAPSQ